MTHPKKAALEKAKSTPKDAIALLKGDHQAVSRLFAEYEESRSIPRKKALVAELCAQLLVHMRIEEEIFYPAMNDVLKDKMVVPEAKVEHAGVSELITQLKDAQYEGDLYDAKVKVLSEYVKHHIKEENTEMFPRARESSLDMVELGARMAARRDELLIISA